MADELLHYKQLRDLHDRFASEHNETGDPKQGFAEMGLCGGCVIDMANSTLKTAAREIGIPVPAGPTTLPLALSMYSYGIFIGMEIERSRHG